MDAVPEKSIESYRQGLARRMLAEEVELEARFQEAWAVAKSAADYLCANYDVAEVYLFGSLVYRDLFHRRSDIDLAVKGLPARDYYRAVSNLLNLSNTFSFDLVLFEEAAPSLQACIAKEGIHL